MPDSPSAKYTSAARRAIGYDEPQEDGQDALTTVDDVREAAYRDESEVDEPDENVGDPRYNYPAIKKGEDFDTWAEKALREIEKQAKHLGDDVSWVTELNKKKRQYDSKDKMWVNSRDNTKRFSEIEKLSRVSFFRYSNEYQPSALINHTFQDMTGPHGDFFRQAARKRIMSNFNTWKSRAIKEFRLWIQAKNEEDKNFLDEDRIDRLETRLKDMFSPELFVDIFRFLKGHVDLYNSRAKAKNRAVSKLYVSLPM